MKGHREKGGPVSVSRCSHAVQVAVAVTGITLVLAVSPLHAAPPASDGGADERNTTQSPPPVPEQVGADSAVSFPVDI